MKKMVEVSCLSKERIGEKFEKGYYFTGYKTKDELIVVNFEGDYFYFKKNEYESFFEIIND